MNYSSNRDHVTLTPKNMKIMSTLHFPFMVFFYFQKSIIYTNIQTGDILQVLKYLKRSEVRLIKLYVNLPLITFIDGYA